MYVHLACTIPFVTRINSLLAVLVVPGTEGIYSQHDNQYTWRYVQPLDSGGACLVDVVGSVSPAAGFSHMSTSLLVYRYVDSSEHVWLPDIPKKPVPQTVYITLYS